MNACILGRGGRSHPPVGGGPVGGGKSTPSFSHNTQSLAPYRTAVTKHAALFISHPYAWSNLRHSTASSTPPRSRTCPRRAPPRDRREEPRPARARPSPRTLGCTTAVSGPRRVVAPERLVQSIGYLRSVPRDDLGVAFAARAPVRRPVGVLAGGAAVRGVDAEFVAPAAPLTRPGPARRARFLLPPRLLLLGGAAVALLPFGEDGREEGVVRVVLDERDAAPSRPRVFVVKRVRGAIHRPGLRLRDQADAREHGHFLCTPRTEEVEELVNGGGVPCLELRLVAVLVVVGGGRVDVVEAAVVDGRHGRCERPRQSEGRVSFPRRRRKDGISSWCHRRFTGVESSGIEPGISGFDRRFTGVESSGIEPGISVPFFGPFSSRFYPGLSMTGPPLRSFATSHHRWRARVLDMAARAIGSGWMPGRIGGRAGSGARASASGRSHDPRAAGVGGDRRSSRATRRGGRADDDCRCRLGNGPRLTSGARLAPAPRAAGRPDANAGARDDDDGARKRRGDRHVANVTGNDRARVASSPPRAAGGGRADRARGRG